MSPDEIKELRYRLRLTQTEFARRLDVSVDTVRAWEGKRAMPPSSMNLYALRQLRDESLERATA
jgi:DNA-binding transcriptional regulator YiaG